MIQIVVPELGVNDTSAVVRRIVVPNASPVKVNDVVLELETTKVALELQAHADGLVRWLVREGDTVSVQQVVGVIGTAEELKTVAEREAVATTSSGYRLTKAARRIAEAAGIGAEQLNALGLAIIREEDVQKLLSSAAERPSPRPHFAERIAVFNAGDGGRTVAQVARAAGIKVACYVDDVLGGDDVTIDGVPVLRFDAFLQRYAASEIAVFVHLQKERKKQLVERLASAGFRAPTLIHPRAIVDSSAVVGEGALIKAGAVVDAFCSIDEHTIVDNGVILPHNACVGSYSHVAPGVTTGGGVAIGSRTVIGIGASIAPEIRIGDDAIVLPGAVITRDVTVGTVVGEQNRVVGATQKASE